MSAAQWQAIEQSLMFFWNRIAIVGLYVRGWGRRSAIQALVEGESDIFAGLEMVTPNFYVQTLALEAA